MNLPQILGENSEEKQNKEHQVKLVRSMLDKDYSPKAIIDLAEVDELGLNREFVKQILGERGASKSALKKMGNNVYEATKTILKFAYLPITKFREINENSFISGPDKLLYTISYLISNLVIAIGAEGLFGQGDEYLLSFLGLGLGNGAYELYNKYSEYKNEAIRENISKLEQITNSENSD